MHQSREINLYYISSTFAIVFNCKIYQEILRMCLDGTDKQV